MERVYQCGETVPVWAEVKNWAGAFVNPSQGVKVTIYNPSGVKKATDEAMTESETGKYVFNYASQVEDEKGWWRTDGIATDGAGEGEKYTIRIAGFKLE